MKVNYLAPLLCIGVLALTGCNDPKKPSESNFKRSCTAVSGYCIPGMLYQS